MRALLRSALRMNQQRACREAMTKEIVILPRLSLEIIAIKWNRKQLQEDDWLARLRAYELQNRGYE